MRINQNDNVDVNLKNGHKYAICDIKKGENVIKYGFPIGHTLCDVKSGEHIHSHNLKTNLGDILEYKYHPKKAEIDRTQPISILAYKRDNGKEIGIRNDIWIVNTVGCINKTAEILARKTGAFYFPHPFGCSQLGDDRIITQKILCGLIRHPNAGGVLVLGLGCENNNISEMKKALGKYDDKRVRFLEVQSCSDEIKIGIEIIEELKKYAEQFKRESVPISMLKVGLKCGGSDGLSGITANPMVGRFSDKLISMGGTAVLTEVPEMFGAETILMQRCENEDVFLKTVALINDFKKYFIKHNQEIYENPSPGNKEGGITTLEEKSLGCIQKGGMSTIVDVLDYGENLNKKGLNLLNGPGNDIVAITNLTSCGCHLILFTTGRGTPLGAPIPTVKIATNTNLATQKQHWIDFDSQNSDNLFDYVIKVVNGEIFTNNEQNEYREIAIFKDGVIL